MVSAASRATPIGLLSWAEVAGPPSPVKPLFLGLFTGPRPATVVMMYPDVVCARHTAGRNANAAPPRQTRIANRRLLSGTRPGFSQYRLTRVDPAFPCAAMPPRPPPVRPTG